MEKDQRDKLDQMKESYHSIPVPKEAMQRIKAGIERAEREERKRKIMKLTKNTGLTAAAALLAITVLANANYTTAHAMERIPVIGAIAKVVTFRTFEDKKGNYEAKVEVPQVSLGNDVDDAGVNRSLEEYADQLIAEYEQELAKDQVGEGHYAMDSTYDVVTDNDNYLSLKITTTVVMASGAESVKIFTIDKATGHVVTLGDMLGNQDEKLTAVSDNIKQQMTDQMAADDSRIYFYNSGDSAMADSEFKGINGDQNFYLNEAGEIVIVFDEYEVAPGYMGVVEFTIPQSVTGISS